MNLEYTLNREDFMTYQLFMATLSKRIQAKRRRHRLLIPVIYTGIGILLYFLQGLVYLLTFLAVGLLWLIFYPAFYRWIYKKNISQFVDEHCRNRIGQKISITLEEEILLLRDKGSDTRIKLTEIDCLYDIGRNVFLHLRSETSVIIPRSGISTGEVEDFLHQLENRTGLSRICLDWKWR